MVSFFTLVNLLECNVLQRCFSLIKSSVQKPIKNSKRITRRGKRAFFQFGDENNKDRFYFKGSLPNEAIQQIDYDKKNWKTIYQNHYFRLRQNTDDGNFLLVIGNGNGGKMVKIENQDLRYFKTCTRRFYSGVKLKDVFPKPNLLGINTKKVNQKKVYNLNQQMQINAQKKSELSMSSP